MHHALSCRLVWQVTAAVFVQDGNTPAEVVRATWSADQAAASEPHLCDALLAALQAAQAVAMAAPRVGPTFQLASSMAFQSVGRCMLPGRGETAHGNRAVHI
jgi:hypothetical protein